MWDERTGSDGKREVYETGRRKSGGVVGVRVSTPLRFESSVDLGVGSIQTHSRSKMSFPDFFLLFFELNLNPVSEGESLRTYRDSFLFLSVKYDSVRVIELI